MSAGQRALELVEDTLAVKRLTRLVVEDQVTEPARNLVWRRFGGPESLKGISYLISCPHCTSIWVAALVVTARIMVPTVWSPVARGLALSSVTSLIAERE